MLVDAIHSTTRQIGKKSQTVFSTKVSFNRAKRSTKLKDMLLRTATDSTPLDRTINKQTGQKRQEIRLTALVTIKMERWVALVLSQHLHRGPRDIIKLVVKEIMFQEEEQVGRVIDID